MAEALLAFGIAANIVTFVDFTSKIIGAGTTKYGGFSDVNLIETVNSDLRSTIQALEKSIREQQNQSPTQNQLELLNLAEQCSIVAAELFAVLNSLKVQVTVQVRSDNSIPGWSSWKKTRPVQAKWQNFRAALKEVWKDNEIRALEDRLDKFRQQLVLHILVALR